MWPSQGTKANGHNYTLKAVAAGSIVVVMCENSPSQPIKDITYVVAADSAQEALGIIASNFMATLLPNWN